jgi:hypothetical protein
MNTQNENYTLKQAMDQLGLKSANAFLQLARRYPTDFIVVKQPKGKPIRYDKGAIDKFVELRDMFGEIEGKKAQ